MRAPPAVIDGMTRTRTFALAGCVFMAVLSGAAASAFAQQDEAPSDDVLEVGPELAAQAPREWPRIEFAHRATDLTLGDAAADSSDPDESAAAGDLPVAVADTGAPEPAADKAPSADKETSDNEAAVEETGADVPMDRVAAASDHEALVEPDHALDVPQLEPARQIEAESQTGPGPEAETEAEVGGDGAANGAEEVPVASEPMSESRSQSEPRPRIIGGDLEIPALPKARNIDLTEPVVGELQSEVEVLPSSAGDEVELVSGEELVLLGARVEPGTTTRLSWSAHDAFEGISVPTPVLVVNGAKPGPVLCLTGAVHGDELNGIEVIRRVMYDLNAAQVSGTVIGVPIVNQAGFRLNSRYLPDRRDLNRYFPGTPDGSSAARIAYSFFQDIVVHCDMLVDVHTGSFHRTNLPQLRADLNNPAVAEFARAFGDMVVLHGEGQPGTLRREAVEIGIPAVTVEAGEPMRIQEDAVADGVKGIRTLMTSLGMSSRPFFWSRPRPAYYHSYWVRASRGGLLMSSVQLGAQVREGELLGVVINPITNEQSDIVSPFAGKVIGMALNQVVMPGFAAYHVGVQASEAEMRQVADDVAEAVEDPEGDSALREPADGAVRGDLKQSDLLQDEMSDAPEHREE